MILEKRRQEEAKRNPNTKCRVVVKDTLKVGEAKPEAVSNSKEMLKKVRLCGTRSFSVNLLKLIFFEDHCDVGR